MNSKFLTKSSRNLQDIILNLKQEENNNYLKILDINKQYELTEDEWKIKSIISKFENLLKTLQRKYDVINNKVERNLIKIFLFGKVSVGKSMLLNAILADNLFSSGIAHTTNCFVHVKLSDDSKYKIKSKKGWEPFDKKEFVENLENMSSAIAKDCKHQPNETIEVEICINENKILKEGIELIDCPGSGNKNSITDQIKKRSEDADIFIFVMNCTLSDEDKVFFKYQSEFSTKPDVFIVINSWDQSDNDDDEEATQMSKKKIEEECITFLQRLGITDNDELLDRIYFLSSLEMFQIRVENDDSIIDQNENAKKRQNEFLRFEYNLSKYIENPKENRSRRYKIEIQQINDEVSKEIGKFKKDILQPKDESLESNYRNLIEALNKFKIKIKQNSEETRQFLSRKIDNLIDQIIHDPNKVNTELVTSKLEECNADLNGGLHDAWNRQYKEFVNFLKSQDEIGKSNSLHNDNKPTIKKLWNPTVIKYSDEPIGEQNNSLTGLIEQLPILPIPNPKFQLIYLGVKFVTQIICDVMKKEELESHNQQIINQLNVKKLEMISNIEDNVKILCDHYVEMAENVIGIFQEKITLFKQYWKKMESTCNELN